MSKGNLFEKLSHIQQDQVSVILQCRVLRVDERKLGHVSKGITCRDLEEDKTHSILF